MEATTLPRPEYPRPQFVRDKWINLNGEWEFAFDDADHGLQEGWADGRTLPKRIVVPFPYQSRLSGINDRGIHEVVWYARSFQIPVDWNGNDVILNFGAVDYRTTVWINGREVGHNSGGHVPFDFEVAPYLLPPGQENRLTMRVEDRQNPHQPRGKQASSGVPQGIDYYCTTGIWQTVWLESAPTVRIDELHITPFVEEEAFQIEVWLHAPGSGWRIEVDVLDGHEVVATASNIAPLATTRILLVVPDVKLWSPASPHLYGLRVRMYDGEQLLDEIESYAGMRNVKLRNGQVVLNGEPVYLAMVLDQGYWPESYLAAPSDEAMRADVEWIRRFGFNGVRKHQKVEDPRWLYWCDRLGLLVWSEMANARAWSHSAEEALFAEWARAVHRDYNHPCIICWVPVNESMGFPGLQQSHPGQYAFLEHMVQVTRHLDPWRPVIDNDGWEHTDITDICAIHDYTPDAEGLRKRYEATLQGGPLPETVWFGDKPLFVRGSRFRGQPIMLTEVGGFLALPVGLPPEQRDSLYQFYASFRTLEELLEKYRDLMAGIASLPFLAGFCYTQLTDIEQEINGLLTYDRKPKVDPETLAQIHRDMIASAKRK